MSYDNAPQFHYTLLQSRCIRVLQILSSPDQINVEISLKVVSLDDICPYDCLSYTWGDPWDPKLPLLPLPPTPKDPFLRMTGDRTENIYVQGQHIKVSQNCLHALKRLSGDYQRQPWIWIDAICIDQDTGMEKAAQIPLMGEIYQHADNVIIWLGKEDRGTRDAQKLLQSLSSVDPDSEVLASRAYNIDTSQAYEQLMQASEDLGMFDIGIDEWLHLAHFLQRTWFSRVWVVQEVFFSKHAPRVLLGDQELDWAEIMKSMDVLAKTHLDTILKAYVLDLPANEEPYNIARAAAEVIDNRLINARLFGTMYAQKEKKRFRLDQLLYYTRQFNATEPKDHVFGIQGLWAPSNAGNESPSRALPPYDSPFQTTFTKATCIAIDEAGNLDMLGLCGGVSEGLPTWVVDFRQKLQLYPLTRNLEFDDYPRRWRAGNGIIPAPVQRMDHSDLKRLPVGGFEFDQVIGERAPSFEEVDCSFRINGLLQILAQARQDIYGAGNIYASFLRSIIKDTYAGEPADTKIFDAFSAFLTMRIWEHEKQLQDDACTDARDTNQNLADLLEETRNIVNKLSAEYPKFPSWAKVQEIKLILGQDDTPETVELDDQLKEFVESFRIAYSGRRLFQTRKGYLGITSESVEEGDKVWISPQSDTPLILRSMTDDQEYSFVGDAYIHGIMYGEAADSKRYSFVYIV